MNCDTCAERRKQAEPVAYIAFESIKATMERTIKRLWIVVLVLILLLAGTNAAWIYYESQWETVETWQDVTQTAEGDGSVRFVGGDYYGIAEGADAHEKPLS